MNVNGNLREDVRSEVLFGQDARARVKAGIDLACGAIASTVGPGGRNAFLDSEMQPTVTNDGVSIARAIKPEDNFAKMGAWLVNNTCDKTFDDVGDSTTTTAILLRAIVDGAMARPENPVEVRRSLRAAGRQVGDWVLESASPVDTDEQIRGVAAVAGESGEIGDLVAGIIREVGRDRPIRVEDGSFPEVTHEVVDGLECRVGYASPLFITDEAQGVAELENVRVFASDRQISSLPDLKALLETLQKEGVTTLVFLVANMDRSVKGAFVANKLASRFNSLVIEVRGQELEDMAAACGATLVSDATGVKLSDVKMEHLGTAKKIVASERKTLVVGTGSDVTAAAVLRLRKAAELTKNVYEAQHLTKRADALEGGVAVIKVGAHTDTERADLKLKILNAVNATKTALEEGVVEGGGMCLYRCAGRIRGNSPGEAILRTALRAPLRCIAENAGEDYAEVAKRITADRGFDAATGRTADLRAAGIVDSAKATRCALANALSTASEFITTGLAVTSLKETK